MKLERELECRCIGNSNKLMMQNRTHFFRIFLESYQFTRLLICLQKIGQITKGVPEDPFHAVVWYKLSLSLYLNFGFKLQVVILGFFFLAQESSTNHWGLVLVVGVQCVSVVYSGYKVQFLLFKKMLLDVISQKCFSWLLH